MRGSLRLGDKVCVFVAIITVDEDEEAEEEEDVFRCKNARLAVRTASIASVLLAAFTAA